MCSEGFTTVTFTDRGVKKYKIRNLIFSAETQNNWRRCFSAYHPQHEAGGCADYSYSFGYLGILSP